MNECDPVLDVVFALKSTCCQMTFSRVFSIEREEEEEEEESARVLVVVACRCCSLPPCCTQRRLLFAMESVEWFLRLSSFFYMRISSSFVGRHHLGVK